MAGPPAQSRKRFNRAQRVVVVIALGVVLDLLGGWLTSLGSYTGWVGYAPLAATNDLAYAGSGLHPWERFAVWVGLTVVWAAAALLLLRTPRSSERPVTDSPAGGG
ncbi:MAG: hypothetical protein ABSH30_10565 [Acidimicrobiales bacterium]